ncbi:phenylalanine--tRNA ligase subunit alpha [Ichthyobacterium seriolicida]|uniref:Phenylalanine--tRNA ligase alpha subunit n=1 Tax=Ichthyobacterium seriolicida TaxID=242600 RepID=A0A1J1DWA5_9FLAO|nr:phenylalanine--tRNA ligase subunit alpha [Ichthyobacterium seriolicida]BAV94145.1 phenylalanyl-tRNA synthetase alpha chain [Ichthyobacterium seriolicida]
MLAEIEKLKQEITDFQSTDKNQIEDFKIKFLGKKGLVAHYFSLFKNVEKNDRKVFGQSINELKTLATDKVNDLLDRVDSNDKHHTENDLTRPAEYLDLGNRHPISLIRKRIVDIFSGIGFGVSQGPEIEDDWHNFTGLNLPEFHPARDMQDTFFIRKNPDFLLRTHTSSVQMHYMENNKPPIRTISPGRVFRNEDISARSHCIFHQIEGLYIDTDVSFADLKQTVIYFTKELFGKSKIRFRPSYFPFTEPSAEVDIYWGMKSEADKRITKGTGWLEIMGCGMVDPNVLKNANIDHKKYSGFAFGMGIERIAMLIYQIKDLRMFFENDIRFLKQFQMEL